MPDPGDLFLFATIRPKPAHFDDARAALDSLVPLTLAEPGCRVFAAFQSGDAGHRVLHLFERFRDQAALDLHYAQPYTRAVFAKYEMWLSAPVDIVRLNPISLQASAQFP
ncbi:putative quinol monooxygenase [uncultured Tateyamaria sp.]|uniref:putative quinol monooxygenase n=1 Tax=Tateyamaria sp. 1078 TaxID=3417464 RepID=UPI002627109A|nr:putative quinol monooxygenase [uncultured Tateyamaria sp.]